MSSNGSDIPRQLEDSMIEHKSHTTKRTYPRLDYRNKMIMAPMVKIGTTPARLVALHYGADIVYTEEIIDFRLLRSSRIENPVLNTIDYIDRSDDTVVLRISPKERGHLVIQIGTSDADRAIRVAKMVCNDVDGLDVNMGCPKSFSMKGGMGAALLSQPNKIKTILTGLVNAVGKEIPITCKIRILSSIEKTLELVKVIQETGVSALAVHGRTKDERPNNDVHLDYIQAVAKFAKIPIIANGASSNNRESSANTYKGIKDFLEKSGASSIMIARACEWNPSVFRKSGEKDDIFNVIKIYLDYALEYDYPFTIVKYNLQNILGSQQESELGKQFLASSTMHDLCKVFDMEKSYDSRKEHIRTLSNELGFDKTLSSSLSLSPKVARRDTSIQATIPHKRLFTELVDSSEKGNIDDKSVSKEILSILEQEFDKDKMEDIKKQSCIYEMYIPFIRGHYKEPMDIPKTKLFLWMKKHVPEDIQPIYHTWGRNNMFRSVLYIKWEGLTMCKEATSSPLAQSIENTKGVFFSSESWEKNKKYSEQAAAVAALHCLNAKEFRYDESRKKTTATDKSDNTKEDKPQLNSCKINVQNEESPMKKLKLHS